VSTPAVGDIDGDGDNEIVVTVNGGTTDAVRVYDENSGGSPLGTPFAQASSASWRFERLAGDHPAAGPSLADLDLDGDMEIIVSDLSFRTSADANLKIATECRVAVFDYDGAGGLNSVWAADSIPITQRNDPLDPYASGIQAVGSAIVGDFDCDGEEFRPDILVTYSCGAICAFEYDPSEGSLEPKPGWPLLMTDVPREPVLFVDPADDDRSCLLVQNEDGWLHLYELPRVSDATCSVQWGSYGNDRGNTRLAVGVSMSSPSWRPQIDRIPTFGILSITPSPMVSNQAIRFSAAPAEETTLEIFDVRGRRVRVLHEGNPKAPETTVSWDGRDERGSEVPSGVYWAQLTAGRRSTSARTVVTR